MIYSNIALEVQVKGDWKKALEEAQALAKELGVEIKLNFLDQKIWIIDEYSNLDKLKEEGISII